MTLATIYVAGVLLLVAGILLAPLVKRLANRLRSGRPESDNRTMQGDCIKHDWANWSAPSTIDVEFPIDVEFHGFQSSYGTSQPSTTRQGLFQDRFCLRCNLYERRVT